MSRIETLLREMTLAEKLGQLTMTAGSHAVTGPVLAGDSTDAIRQGSVGNVLNVYGRDHVHALQRLAVEQSRLGIPVLFALDVVHGHRTLFPVPLAEAGLMDPATWERSAREAAIETAADGIAMTFAPMLDVARDPRWGRTVEGPGEDPWLASTYARAKVRGFQAASLGAAQSVAAVAKHYCAYGAAGGGRDYASVEVSARTLREVYLPPFAAAVQAGVAAIMPAFTDIGGVPTTADALLLGTVLRGELGFEGVLVSDYNAIAELIPHGVAADLVEAAALALRAGVDIDMMAGAYRQGLPVALERGLIELAQVDASVRRVLVLKERLGLFDDPYGRGREAESPAALAARRQLARETAARALVLLTHRRPVLPLGADLKDIALIGPLATAAAEMRGPWWAAAGEGDSVTVLEGLRAAWPSARIRHEAGVPLRERATTGIAAAVGACAGAGAVVLCLGEAAVMSGEAASRTRLRLPGAQAELAAAVLAAAARDRQPVVVLLFSGRPLVVPELLSGADAVIAAHFPGTQAGHAVADVLIGRTAPAGRLTVSWPRTEGQIPVCFGARPTGRPADPANFYSSKYLDEVNEPEFHFGHGLTYGACTLHSIRVGPAELGREGTVRIDLEVANDSSRELEHTVYAFVRDRVASVARPLLELKGATCVRVPPAGRVPAHIEIDAAALAFPGPDLRPVLEPGEFEVCVGSSADPAGLSRHVIRLR